MQHRLSFIITSFDMTIYHRKNFWMPSIGLIFREIW